MLTNYDILGCGNTVPATGTNKNDCVTSSSGDYGKCTLVNCVGITFGSICERDVKTTPAPPPPPPPPASGSTCLKSGTAVLLGMFFFYYQ